MDKQHAAFTGSVPENYDRYLGPVLFEPYARDLAGRVDVGEGARVLELACGTGILTRRLRERLPLNVWDALGRNDLARVAHTTISKFFESDPPTFYQVPFSLHDTEAVTSLLTSASFEDIELAPLALPSISPSAEEAARGLVKGNPVIVAIRERMPSDVEKIEAAVAEAVAARCGDRPVEGEMRVFVFTAAR